MTGTNEAIMNDDELNSLLMDLESEIEVEAEEETVEAKDDLDLSEEIDEAVERELEVADEIHSSIEDSIEVKKAVEVEVEAKEKPKTTRSSSKMTGFTAIDDKDMFIGMCGMENKAELVDVYEALPVKQKDKVLNIYKCIHAENQLSVYTAKGIQYLTEHKSISTKDFKNSLMDSYSPGTASSQASQTTNIFHKLNVTTKGAGNVFEINKDSALLKALSEVV